MHKTAKAGENNPNIQLVLLAAGLILLFSRCSANKQSKVVNLRSDHRENPINIDIETPLFSWQMETLRRGAAQTAYQVIVSDNGKMIRKNQGNIWDSGKVVSSQSVHLPFLGTTLQSSGQYWWKVRIWDEQGVDSSWSDAARFETAFLHLTDWQAQWIGRPIEEKPASDFDNLYWIWHPAGNIHWKMIYFEKNFTAEHVIDGKVWVAADNSYENFLNDESLGGHREYTPNPASRFFEYDLTGQLKEEENTIRVSAVQTTRERNAGAIARIMLKNSDGTETIINTDSSWKAYLAMNYGFVSHQKEWEPAMQAVELEKHPGNQWGELVLPYIPPRSVLLRKEVDLPKKVKNARDY